MQKKILLAPDLLSFTVSRMCRQLAENHGDFSKTVILGIQPRGSFFANRVRDRIKEIFGTDVPTGYLDVTFHRDDFRRRDTPLRPNMTHVPFLTEGKKVILADDVLFTGRTINAALNAMQAFGRPEKVELLVLVDRLYSRELPVSPDYVGKSVNTILSQRVLVEWTEQGAEKDCIWLLGDDFDNEELKTKH
jgi:pyrimidine operon attenuation protein/uracil phosphoribosyltransferase